MADVANSYPCGQHLCFGLVIESVAINVSTGGMPVQGNVKKATMQDAEDVWIEVIADISRLFMEQANLG